MNCLKSENLNLESQNPLVNGRYNDLIENGPHRRSKIA